MIVKLRGPGKRVKNVAVTSSMLVKELKEEAAKVFPVEPENQRLVFRWKQLEDQLRLSDYGMQSNDLVLLTVKPKVIQKEVVSEFQEPLSFEKHLKTLRQVQQSKHFKVGEYVDFVDTHFGAWFQGKIKVIYVEDQARLDAISEEIDLPFQQNEERKDDCGSTVVGDCTKDTPAQTTSRRDSLIEISDDDSIDVVTVRSSSPESVIYVPPPEGETVIYHPPQQGVLSLSSFNERDVYVPPEIYVEPYSDGIVTVDTIADTPISHGNEQEVPQETTRDQSSKNSNAVSDTNGRKTVGTIGNKRRSSGKKQGAQQEITCDKSSNKTNAARGRRGRKDADGTGETPQDALQRALQEALLEMTRNQYPDRVNGVSDTDHSESGDSGHSSHMSLKNTSQSKGEEVLPDDGCLYEIINLNNIDEIYMMCKLSQIRPMSRKRLDLTEVRCGQTVLVNYSDEGPDKLGHWFDFKVSKVVNSYKKKWLEGDINVRNWNPYQVEDVKITKLDMIWQIEKLTFLNQREEFCSAQKVQKRPVRAICDKCNDNPAAQCTVCSCQVCGMKSDPSKQILCDECNSAYHVWCLTPPLSEVPDVDQWFCSKCDITTTGTVKAGEEPRVGKKRGRKPKVMDSSTKENSTSPKGKNASTKENSTSPKGKDASSKVKNKSPKVRSSSPIVRSSSPKVTSMSPIVTSVSTIRHTMANAARTKKCTIVPPNHFGPIPGVEVGTTWRFRIQASEAGVHRPPVGGMHGREDVGAFSIVLSGGYEDDEDFGECFWYTGAGGRDLSGNRRTTNRQSCDQLFTHTNKALALNCDAPLSDEGGKAVNWRAGKPVRVLRSYKFRKRSQYAPEEGLRYDGIYKVVEYRPERGRSGFIVWKYFLRRDDPTPAPWTEEGKKFMETLGLEIEYPENYEPIPTPAKKKSEESSKKPVADPVMNESEENSFNYRIKLEPCDMNISIEENHIMDENEEDCLYKRMKPAPYELDPSIEEIIARDEQNLRLWEHCSFFLRDGKEKYLEAVQENFTCTCCRELLYEPITTPCSHNICQDCLQRSVQAEVYTCPACSEDLPDYFPFVVNEHLSEALKALFPGYGPQREMSFEQG